MARQSKGSPSSITDVAALAKVSIATVSRVLSGKRQKNDDIAQRVRTAAAQLDYSVNHAASSLRSSRTSTIGIVIPSATDMFAAQLLNALEPIADDHEEQLLLGIGADKALQTARIESLVARNVDGLIVVCAQGADLTHILERHTPNLPIVQIGRAHRSPNISTVAIDELLSMEQIIAHLSSLGTSSVAYLAGEQFSFEAAEMLTMLHTQLRSFGLDTRPEWNRFGECTMQRGFDDTMQILAGDRPDAIICADDTIAFGVMSALQSRGIRVPDDIKVVGANDSPLDQQMNPRLTTLRQPFEQIADEALRLIEHVPAYPSHISLMSKLVVRESTAGVAANPALQIEA